MCNLYYLDLFLSDWVEVNCGTFFKSLELGDQTEPENQLENPVGHDGRDL